MAASGGRRTLAGPCVPCSTESTLIKNACCANPLKGAAARDGGTLAGSARRMSLISFRQARARDRAVIGLIAKQRNYFSAHFQQRMDVDTGLEPHRIEHENEIFGRYI